MWMCGAQVTERRVRLLPPRTGRHVAVGTDVVCMPGNALHVSMQAVNKQLLISVGRERVCDRLTVSLAE